MKKVINKDLIIEELKQVFDPEFPVVDIYTLGLIYDVEVIDEDKHVTVLMTFTTPSCPLADTIKEMIRNAVIKAVPGYSVDIEVTFDPMWSMDMVRDPDVKRMFE